MKCIFALLMSLTFISVSVPAHSDEHVMGRVTKNGTNIQPHRQSSPDGNVWNYQTNRGNPNRYTVQPGTRNPYGSGSGGYGNFGNSGDGYRLR